MSEIFKKWDPVNVNALLAEFDKDEKDVMVPCNIWKTIKQVLTDMAMMMNDIQQNKADIKTLEGLVGI